GECKGDGRARGFGLAWGRGEATPVWGGRVSGEGARDRAPSRKPDGGLAVPGSDAQRARGGGQGPATPPLAEDRVGQLLPARAGGRVRPRRAVPPELRAPRGEGPKEGGGGLAGWDAGWGNAL
ncbi:MAG: hypothetical protein AVDCRST_MAG78-2143, partial [uncultured Rubrobacteraceae bacterium]